MSKEEVTKIKQNVCGLGRPPFLLLHHSSPEKKLNLEKQRSKIRGGGEEKIRRGEK